MPTKPTNTVQNVNSQAADRWPETFYDQHTSKRFPKGRPWWTYLALPAERRDAPGPVCELVPGDHLDPMGSGWDAPWLPPQLSSVRLQYFRLDLRAKKLTWLYPTMIGEAKRAAQAYYDECALVAIEHGWEPPALYGPVGHRFTAKFGPPPESPKIPEAALAGDPWLLGFSTEVNTVLAALLAGPVAVEAPAVPAGYVAENEMQRRIDAAVASAVQKAVAGALKKSA